MPVDTLDVDALVQRLTQSIVAHLRVSEDRLLNRAELADRLGVSNRSVGSMVSRQEIPPPLLHTSGIARWSWPTVLKHLAARQGRKHRKGRGIRARRQLVETERQQ